MNDKQQHAILVVDDIKDWRDTLCGLLEDAGYRVGVAGSMDEASQALSEQSFDLAVVDVRLDETDETNTEGLDLASRIKTHWQNIKVVLITGYGTTKIVEQAFARDGKGRPLVNEYVPKTATEELVKRVKDILGD